MENKIVSRIIAYLRQGKILSDDIGKDIHAYVLRPTDRHSTYGDLCVGDYDIYFIDNLDSLRIDYRPEGHENWRDNVDQDLIVSFDKPPLKKALDTDQSEQGKSVENNAQPHTTTNGEEGQA